MKKYTMLLIFILLAMPVLSLDADAAGFNDIKGHWSEGYVSRLVDDNIINGYPDGTFRPDGTITRAEFIAILYKSAGYGKVGGHAFNDAFNHWSDGIATAAVAAGILEMGDYWNRDEELYFFQPDREISRQEMAVLIVRAMNISAETKDAGKPDYSDSGQIEVGDEGFVKLASDMGIITGYPDGSFGPGRKATRGEACVMINRMLDLDDYRDAAVAVDDIIESSLVSIYGRESQGEMVYRGGGLLLGDGDKVLCNYTVIEGLDQVELSGQDGSRIQVSTVYGYNEGRDISILNLDKAVESDYLVEDFRNPYIGDELSAAYTGGDGRGGKEKVKISDADFIDGFFRFDVDRYGDWDHGFVFDDQGNLAGILTSNFFNEGEISQMVPSSDIVNMLLSDNREIALDEVARCGEFDCEVLGSYGGYVFPVFSEESDFVDQPATTLYREYRKMRGMRFGYELRIFHDETLAGNVIEPMVFVKDDNGNVLWVEKTKIKLNEKGNLTRVVRNFQKEMLMDFEEGNYVLELHVEGEELYTWEISILPGEEEGRGDIGSAELTVISNEIYRESNFTELKPETTFEQPYMLAAAYHIKGSLSKPAEFDRKLIFEILAESEDGFLNNSYKTIYVKEGDMDFETVAVVELEYRSNKHSYPLGDYDITLLYNNVPLDTGEFTVEWTDISSHIEVETPEKDTVFEILADDHFCEGVNYIFKNMEREFLIDHHLRIRSSKEDTPVFNYQEIHSISHGNESYSFNGIGLTSEQRADAVEGESFQLEFYANENLTGSYPLKVTLPEINSNFHDAFMVIAPNQDFDWQQDYFMGYDSIKVWEQPSYSLAYENYLYVMISYDSDRYVRGGYELGYVDIRIINEDDGARVISHREAYVPYKDNKAVIKVAEDDQMATFKPGRYRMEIRTEPDGPVVLSKSYTVTR